MNSTSKDSTVMLENVPYTVSDGGYVQAKDSAGSPSNAASDSIPGSGTYGFSTSNSYGFVRIFHFSLGPNAGTNLKKSNESPGLLSSLILPALLLGMLKLLSGALSLPESSSQNANLKPRQ